MSAIKQMTTPIIKPDTIILVPCTKEDVQPKERYAFEGLSINIHHELDKAEILFCLDGVCYIDKEVDLTQIKKRLIEKASSQLEITNT